MKNKPIRKILSLIFIFNLIFQQSGFAQMIGQVDIAKYLNQMKSFSVQDKFRPLHLRYFSYDALTNNFEILLDKGDLKDIKDYQLKEQGQELLEYFLIGITLPDENFWVNLRPDSESQIIDGELAQTEVGKILLEADLQLKKDTATFTSPQTPEGRAYWNKLYQKAGQLFGTDNVTIPTLTRPWIVPQEVIIRESADSAYVYKATLKVMLEQDHLKNSADYNFKDERLKELNEYSSQLIRENIIPKLTKEVNTSKKYASLRQIFYSLILSRWFKARFSGKSGLYPELINKHNLNGLTSQEPWSKTTYFKEYQKSFQNGEYNIKEAVSTLTGGQVIRSYFSGGVQLGANLSATGGLRGINPMVDDAFRRGHHMVGFSGRPGEERHLSDLRPARPRVTSSPLENGKYVRKLQFTNSGEEPVGLHTFLSKQHPGLLRDYGEGWKDGKFQPANSVTLSLLPAGVKDDDKAISLTPALLDTSMINPGEQLILKQDLLVFTGAKAVPEAEAFQLEDVGKLLTFDKPLAAEAWPETQLGQKPLSEGEIRALKPKILEAIAIAYGKFTVSLGTEKVTVIRNDATEGLAWVREVVLAGPEQQITMRVGVQANQLDFMPGHLLGLEYELRRAIKSVVADYYREAETRRQTTASEAEVRGEVEDTANPKQGDVTTASSPVEISGDTLPKFSGGAPTPAEVRPEVFQQVPTAVKVLGSQTVNGRQLDVLSVIADITRSFRGEVAKLSSARRQRLHQEQPTRTFGDPNKSYPDVDGYTMTRAQIRKGMLDHAFDVDSPERWHLKQAGPRVIKPGLQGTGPHDDMGMITSELGSGMASYMWDEEDARSGRRQQIWQGRVNRKEVFAGEWRDRVFHHDRKNKDYRITAPPSEWPEQFLRVPGLELEDESILVDGVPAPATISSLGIDLLNNYDSLGANGFGANYYQPKIDTPEEALLLAKIIDRFERTIGVPRGTITLEKLNEREGHARNQEVINWILRYWLVGDSFGRWDWGASLQELNRNVGVYPDMYTFDMWTKPMHLGAVRNDILLSLVDGFPIGGMAAFMKNNVKPDDPPEVRVEKERNNARVIRLMRLDKVRERLQGLYYLVDGDGNIVKRKDGPRQSWVATTEPEYVQAGTDPLVEPLEQFQAFIDANLNDAERNKLESLGLLKDGRIDLPRYTREQLERWLWSDEMERGLYDIPGGALTERGLRWEVFQSSNYIFQQLNGNSAAAIEDPYSTIIPDAEIRLMTDYATDLGNWHHVWIARHHGVALTADGPTTKKGDRITPDLIRRLLQDRWADVVAYFERQMKIRPLEGQSLQERWERVVQLQEEQDQQGIPRMFDRRLAPVAMEILERQLLHPQWIVYNKRILLSVIEVSAERRAQILDAVFSPSREAVLAKVEAGEWDRELLRIYDYVYDIVPVEAKAQGNAADTAAQPEQGDVAQASSPMTPEDVGVGGIDFRVINMITQPMGNFSGLNFTLPKLSHLEDINLDEELNSIQKLISAGIMPSCERLKEYVAACYQKGAQTQHIDGIITTLVDICRMQEDEISATPDDIKALLLVVDSR